MRRARLIRSIGRLLEPGVEVIDAAYVWRRHHRLVPFSIAAFLGPVAAAPIVGWTGWPERIGLGLAGAGVAIAATTEYRIVALTSAGLQMLAASRVRQVAIGLLGPITGPMPVTGRTMLSSDWEIEGSTYTVNKLSEMAMLRMAAGSPGETDHLTQP